MKLSEYLANPYGKGSSFASLGQVKKDMEAQFYTLQSKFQCQIYLYRNAAIFHVLVPSRDESNITYDVVLEFPLKDLPAEAISLNDADLKLFSNCPSFVFTYANIFYTNKLLCPWLINKYDPRVKRADPSVRNRFHVIGMERSIYLAMYYIRMKGLTRLNTINLMGKTINSYSTISSHVRTQEQMLQEIRSYKQTKREIKEKLAKYPKATTKPRSKQESREGVVPSVKTTKTVGSGTPRTKTTKKTKRLK